MYGNQILFKNKVKIIYKDGSLFSKILKAVILIILLLLILIPFWMLAAASLRESLALMQYPPKFWPDDATLKNYRILLFSKTYQFGRWFLNSIITAGGATLGTLLLSSLAGYGFAKKKFPGREALFTLSLSTLMIPASVTLIPQFLIIRELNLINTYAGIIMPAFGIAFGVFLMRQFISTIPSSLIESAKIDGCSELGIYFHIILPVTTPAMGVLGIYTFMNQWNNLIWPLIVINTENMKTIPLGIAGMKAVLKTPWGLVMAASFLSFIPVFIVFLTARKKFIAGLTAGAVKG